MENFSRGLYEERRAGWGWPLPAACPSPPAHPLPPNRQPAPTHRGLGSWSPPSLPRTPARSPHRATPTCAGLMAFESSWGRAHGPWAQEGSGALPPQTPQRRQPWGDTAATVSERIQQRGSPALVPPGRGRRPPGLRTPQSWSLVSPVTLAWLPPPRRAEDTASPHPTALVSARPVDRAPRVLPSCARLAPRLHPGLRWPLPIRVGSQACLCSSGSPTAPTPGGSGAHLSGASQPCL